MTELPPDSLPSPILSFKRGERVESARVGGAVVAYGVFLETTARGLLARVVGPGEPIGGDGIWLTEGGVGGTGACGPTARDTALARYIDCLAFHSAATRLAGILAAIQDRAPDDRLMITQQQLGSLTGLRRATVNEILGELQAVKALRVGRGEIRILEPDRLAAAGCGCLGRRPGDGDPPAA